MLLRVPPPEPKRCTRRLLHAGHAPRLCRASRRIRIAADGSIRRARCLAHCCWRRYAQGDGRDFDNPGVATLDCTNVDGAGLRIACHRRFLHDRQLSAAKPSMSGIGTGLVIFGVLMVLLVMRVPIGVAMFAGGASGYIYLNEGDMLPFLNSLKNLAYARLSNYDLIVVPL